MRNVSEKAALALLRFERFKCGNTEVRVEDSVSKLYLHNNLIACFDGCGISVTTAGRNTNVTKDRLRSIPCVSLIQKKGKLLLNGNSWDGEWTAILTE